MITTKIKILAIQPVPLLENYMSPDKFLCFLKGDLPNLQDEPIRKRPLPFHMYDLGQLKEEIIDEITLNDMHLPTTYQASAYLNYVSEIIKPINQLLGQDNLMDMVIQEDLYPLPLNLIEHKFGADELTDNMINEVIKTNDTLIGKIKKFNDDQKKDYKLLENLFNCLMWNYEDYREISFEIEWLRTQRGLVKEPSNLSATEIALRQWYLVEAKIEPYIIPRQVGQKYKHLADCTNIAMAYSSFDKNPRTKYPNLKQLKNVKNSLSEYPNIQSAISNDIDKLE